MRYLFIVILFAFGIRLAGQGFVNYQLLPAFPGTARDDVSAFMIGHDVYVTGGLDVNFIAQNDVWKFSGETQTWHPLPAFPATGRLLAKTMQIGSSYCMIGGVTGANTDLAECWCYSSQGWQAFAYPPAPGRRQHAAASANNRAFFGLGMNGNVAYRDWWLYEHAKDGWQTLDDFPGAARKEPVACAWGECVFVGLGVSANDSIAYKDFYRFDVESKHWHKLADYPGFACQYISCTQVSDGVLIVSGINEAFNFSREVWLYKPGEDAWTRLEDYPYPAKKGADVVSANNEFYMICGVDETNTRSNDMVKGTYASPVEGLAVFPNPFTGVVHVKSKQAFDYELYAYSGALIEAGHIPQGLNDLAFPQLERGLYFLRIRQNDGEQFTRKLLKD